MKYSTVFFEQGEGALEYLDIMRDNGKTALMEYLESTGILNLPGIVNTQSQANSQIYDLIVYKDNEYILSFNYRLGYIGLERIIK